MKKVFIHKNELCDVKYLHSINAFRASRGLSMLAVTVHEVPKTAKIEDFVNGVFSQMAHDQRVARELNERYEKEVSEMLRTKYSLNAELAILRQRDSKPAEFEEYNAFAEHCKSTVKAKLGI